MFTFKSPSAEWKVEQLSIAKPPLYFFLKYSRFNANTFSAVPARAKIFGPVGISVKTKMADIAIPAGEIMETSTRRNIQSSFLFLE
jgi:hypothetical protein